MTDTQVEKKSTHIDEAIDAKRPLHGNSRRGGDAPPEIQQKIVDIIIEEGQKLNFSYRDIAYFIAIAKRESGFNPDAANSRSTASGISQMVDKAGKKYGLNDQNRFDARANISAGLQYFQHIKQKIAKDFGSSTGKYEALIYYCYHYGEFSVNRRETVKGAVVVKEPYPISQLEGTPKYLDSQKVVDDAEKFEKIFNDSHALKIKLVDILGKAMAGRKVIAVQKIAIPNTNSTSAVQSNMTSSPTSESKNSNPLSNNAAASQATTNLPVPINTANTKEHTTADKKNKVHLCR